jgi:hypothetical protein
LADEKVVTAQNVTTLLDIMKKSTASDVRQEYERKLAEARRQLQELHVHQYLEALHECGIEPPFAVMTSLIGLHQLKLTTGRRLPAGLVEGQIADRDQLHFREVILEELPIVKQGWVASLRPIIDQLANAAGCVSAESFDD